MFAQFTLFCPTISRGELSLSFLMKSNGKRKLTPKERRFCREYLKDLNAAAAARRAGYSQNPGTSAVRGHILMHRPWVLDYINKLKIERSARTQVSLDRVLLELARVGYASPKDLSEWSDRAVTLKDSKAISDDDAAAVAEVYEVPTERGNVVRFRLHDKVAALKELRKHLTSEKGKEGRKEFKLSYTLEPPKKDEDSE